MITRQILMEQVAQAARDKAKHADAQRAYAVAHGMEQYALFLLDKLEAFEKANDEAAQANAKVREQLLADMNGRAKTEPVEETNG